MLVELPGWVLFCNFFQGANTQLSNNLNLITYMDKDVCTIQKKKESPTMVITWNGFKR